MGYSVKGKDKNKVARFATLFCDLDYLDSLEGLECLDKIGISYSSGSLRRRFLSSQVPDLPPSVL